MNRLSDLARLAHGARRAARRFARGRRAVVGDHREGRQGGTPRGRAPYPGDYRGVVHPVYAPDLDGDADPGEIVWAWIPYEEDPRRGKDRPALVVGRDGPWLLALMLTTRDHDTRPGRPGERWLDLGTGEWDAQGRQSEVRLDRIIRLSPDAVRREGAVLDRERFDTVVGSL